MQLFDHAAVGWSISAFYCLAIDLSLLSHTYIEKKYSSCQRKHYCGLQLLATSLKYDRKNILPSLEHCIIIALAVN